MKVDIDVNPLVAVTYTLGTTEDCLNNYPTFLENFFIFISISKPFALVAGAFISGILIITVFDASIDA